MIFDDYPAIPTIQTLQANKNLHNKKSFRHKHIAFSIFKSLSWANPFQHLKDFSQLWTRIILKQPWTPPQRKTFVASRTSNHILAIETGQWLNIPIPKTNKLRHFFSCNVVQKEAHLCWSVPLQLHLWIDSHPYFRM